MILKIQIHVLVCRIKIQFSDTFGYKGAIHTFAYLFILINDFKII